jgi:1,4-dihydroxy-2-naphthoyl-CoA synthase
MARRESSEASSGDGKVTLRIAGAVAHVLFDRPWARNAMTWAMYDGLATACAEINGNSRVRVAVLRGAGGKAFVAGTDIAQFPEFANGDDGVAYEARLDGFIDTLERLRVPSIAVVQGFASGPASPSRMRAISVSPPPARGSGFQSHAPWATAFRLPISVGFAPRWG